MEEIILLGAGGHAKACIDVIEQMGEFHVAGLVEKGNTKFDLTLGYQIIGDDDDLQKLRTKYKNALITVGQIKNAKIRVRLFRILKKMNYSLPLIISPNSYVSKHAKIGEGTIIMHGATINANARIGKNCIINNQALVEHDVVIGDHCHISTGAILNGEVHIGNESFIGSGAIIKQCLSLGNNCLIEAGVFVKKFDT